MACPQNWVTCFPKEVIAHMLWPRPEEEGSLRVGPCRQRRISIKGLELGKREWEEKASELSSTAPHSHPWKGPGLMGSRQSPQPHAECPGTG